MSHEHVTDVTVTYDITFCLLCLSLNEEKKRNRNSKQNEEKIREGK